MSEVSVLSQEYRTASELSRAINNMAIELKKERRRSPGTEAPAGGARLPNVGTWRTSSRR